MNTTRIDLNILLPGLPHEKDACTNRIIQMLQHKNGIDKVHVLHADNNAKATLCFHYDPSKISLSRVSELAEKAGAELTQTFGHLLIETTGVRQPRHARLVEEKLRKQPGVAYVAVAGTGFIELEYQKSTTSKEAILEQVRKAGLQIAAVHDFHTDKSAADAATGGTPMETTHQSNSHPPATKAPGHTHHHDEDEHAHAHTGMFGEKTELIFAIISGVFLGAGFGLSFIATIPVYVVIGCYLAAYFFGGFYTTKEAVEGISKGNFEIDFLMLVAAVGAAFLGQWAEGALLLFLFSLGHSLEHYAMQKAKKSIAALSGLAPKTALLQSAEGIKEVNINQLQPGDTILVKPHSKIAADGIVVKGSSSVNQAPITGESMPVDKMPVADKDFDISKAATLDAKHTVFAGSINGSNNLEVAVTRRATDSTIARLVTLVNEAQTQKSSTQQFTDRLEKYYVPSVLVLVLLLLFAFVVIDEPFSASFYRAMAVLVAASPCALAISTPSAVLSAVARAARGGVLIKGGKPLEQLGTITAIAFDKTGTLTEGKPALTGVYPLQQVTEAALLEILVAVESLSDHPLAVAIVKAAGEKLQQLPSPASDLTAIQGRGVRANYQGNAIHVGNLALFTDRGSQLPEGLRERVAELEQQGNTTMLVQRQDELIGIITLMDVARKEAKETLLQLRATGIKKMIMLTGDNQAVADAIAGEIGITEARGDLLPEQKVAAIEQLRETEEQIAMVGDGVNDAPAMAKSTVGIAMGAAGSDVALETADIALMADQLGNLPFAIGLSRKSHAIIRQNLFISLGMVAILIPLTILGIAHIGPAVIGHEGSTLVVVFNALRLLAFKKK